MTDELVHETATVEPGAVVGAGTRIWHHAHVRSTARVGEECMLGMNVYVDEHVTVGDRTRVQNNVAIYHGVTLEEEVFVGPAAVFTNDRIPRAMNAGWELVPTFVRRGASIGANATIVCGVEVGEWAMVAAGAVVTKDVAPHELVAGNPARRLGWVCHCGEVLARTTGERPTDAVCPSCSSVLGAKSVPTRPNSRPERGKTR